VYKQVFVYSIGPTACKNTNVTVLEKKSRYNVLTVRILSKQLEKQGELMCAFCIKILQRENPSVCKKREEHTKLENILHNSLELRQIIDLI